MNVKLDPHPKNGAEQQSTLGNAQQGWLGYVDPKNIVHAVRLSQQGIQSITHSDQFGVAVGSLPHRFRMPIENKRLVYWWTDPAEDARRAVDDFFAEKSLEVAGHISLASKGAIASLPTKIGDRMYQVGEMRFHKRTAADEYSRAASKPVTTVVFTKFMTWQKE